jgi:hypothetical protein
MKPLFEGRYYYTQTNAKGLKGCGVRGVSRACVTPAEDWADRLAIQLMISPDAISEALRRSLVSFKKHRRVACWRFGDMRNGCWRRLDGLPFEIKGQRVKAEAETRGDAWHRLIGLDDVITNNQREILLVTEGSKDALAALHFADAEGRLSSVGLVAALGAGVNLCTDDVGKFRGRRVRIFGEADTAGQETVFRVAKQLVSVADQVQIFNLAGLKCQDGSLVKDLFDLSRTERGGLTRTDVARAVAGAAERLVRHV